MYWEYLGERERRGIVKGTGTLLNCDLSEHGRERFNSATFNLVL